MSGKKWKKKPRPCPRCWEKTVYGMAVNHGSFGIEVSEECKACGYKNQYTDLA